MQPCSCLQKGFLQSHISRIFYVSRSMENCFDFKIVFSPFFKLIITLTSICKTNLSKISKIKRSRVFIHSSNKLIFFYQAFSSHNRESSKIKRIYKSEFMNRQFINLSLHKNAENKSIITPSSLLYLAQPSFD